jgi:hypothetical protein
MEVGVMPKETIYGTDGGPVQHVAVGWTHGGGVQVGVVNGPEVSLTINGESANPGLWMDLDRGQINRLIRSLRRARDAAYGRDE